MTRDDEFEDFIQRGEGEVGGDFDKDGGRGWRLDFLEGGEDFVKGGFVLKLAEVGGVGRADVDDKKIGEGTEEAEGIGVVLGGAGQRSNFGLAEIDADRMGGPEAGLFPAGEGGGEGLGAGVVETMLLTSAWSLMARNRRGGGLPG